jgi:hypothetical protein
MLRTYVHRILGHIFCPRLTWRDAFAFLLGVAIPLTVWLTVDEIIEFANELIGWELLAGLGLVILIRAIAAPYDMWRELILHVSELHREMDDIAHSDR